MPRYKMIALSSPKEGRDADFNQWYDNQHLGDVLNVPGFFRAQRYALEDAVAGMPFEYKYLAVYDFESDDLKRTFDYFLSATGTDKLKMTDSMEPKGLLYVCRPTGEPMEKSAPTPWPSE